MEKSSNELGKILANMYTNAKSKEKVTMIHLFGVKYHDDIRRVGVAQVIEESGISSTYKTELTKAVNLAKYVKPI